MMDNRFPNMKAALFDLDGVIFNTEPQYTDFWKTLCREFVPDIPHFEALIKGMTLVQIFDKYFRDRPDVQREIVARLDTFEREMRYDYLPGLLDYVAFLRQNGIGRAVVTSSNLPKMANVYSHHPEFRGLFDHILTSEDFKESKPSPDCYLQAAARFGLSAAECVVFEDSFNGMKSGRAAHMPVVGVASTNTPEAIAPYCNLVIADFRDM